MAGSESIWGNADLEAALMELIDARFLEGKNEAEIREEIRGVTEDAFSAELAEINQERRREIRRDFGIRPRRDE